MTTNAATLNEKKLLELRNAGLSAINISLDTLEERKFASITRRPGKILGQQFLLHAHASDKSLTPVVCHDRPSSERNRDSFHGLSTSSQGCSWHSPPPFLYFSVHSSRSFSIETRPMVFAITGQLRGDEGLQRK